MLQTRNSLQTQMPGSRISSTRYEYGTGRLFASLLTLDIFQVQAWTTCNVLFMSPDVPEACKTFAAQTLRAKVGISLKNQALIRDYKVSRSVSVLMHLSILSLLAAEAPLHLGGDHLFSQFAGSGTGLKDHISIHVSPLRA